MRDFTPVVVFKDPEVIIPYARNAKTHPKEQILKIAAQIDGVGFTQPILIDKDGVVIAGHGRRLAAIELGMKSVPVIVVDHLSEDEVMAVRIADNKLAESDWDVSLLAFDLGTLERREFDLTLTGMNTDAIAEAMKSLNVPDPSDPSNGGTDDEDDVPPPPLTIHSREGDIWQCGNHRVMCGDSMDESDVGFLMANRKADMVFTDPPYGYEYESNFQEKHEGLLNDDKIQDFTPIAAKFMRDNSAIFVCGSHQTIHQWRPLIDAHFKYKNLIVWKKNNWSMGDLTGAFAGQHELILFAHKGRVEIRGERSRDVWEFDRDPPTDHPTQKPVRLVAFAIEKTTDQNDLVLDLFGGSGSTLIAAEQLGRVSYTMELAPRYVDVILERWARLTGKDPVRSDGRLWSDLRSNGPNQDDN